MTNIAFNMKVDDLVYSIEYDLYGKLLEINGNEAVIEAIHRESSNIPKEGQDLIYCDLRRCGLASEQELQELFKL